jgi:DinB superfamily
VHPQLQAVVDEFSAAQERLHALARVTPAAWWGARSDPARWSIGECVAHLNLTAEAFLPLLRHGIEQGRRLSTKPGVRFRRDPVGWLLWRTTGPPVRHRVRTPAPFVPSGSEPREAALAAFDRLQAEQIGAVRDADGVPLTSVRITSPFDRRIRYNLYSCFTILPRHQERHIWQAEQVLEGLRRTK